MQEWFVGERAEPPVVVGARSTAPTPPGPRPACSTRSRTADTIVICPSNPVISIGPILAVPGIRDVLVARRDRVVGGQPDRRRRAGEGPGRPADGPARHRRLVRRRRPRTTPSSAARS